MSLALGLTLALAAAQETTVASAEEARRGMDRAVAYLLETQRDDGSWGSSAPESVFDLGFAPDTFQAWNMAAQALACMALARIEEKPERRAALERGLTWLLETRVPTRGSDWDIDQVWSLLYGFVACVELARDPRFAAEPWAAALDRRGAEFGAGLVRHQALSGGWAYYDDPPFDTTPTWATSFCTALVLPSLEASRELGWGVDATVIARARRYVTKCAMPNGAFTYDLNPVPRIAGVEHINLIEGSLGRTQVCLWAMMADPQAGYGVEDARAGLEALFTHHGYLDHVRTRPIPHEGFHANAGYFYFFAHYYAARLISLLPREEREGWHARLRPHLLKTQQPSGRTSDFLDSTYMITASTSYLVLALAEGLEDGGPSAVPAALAPDAEAPR